MGVDAVRQQGRVLQTIPFRSGDGLRCSLVHAERPGTRPTKGPVLLVHGAGVRASLFLPPQRPDLVDTLLDAGYDVWLENWRASIDVPPNPWDLDQAAVHDHPRAVRAVLDRTGHSTLKAVVHCQGSTSFLLSAAAGLLPEVTHIVSNAVSLHPVVPAWSRVKLTRFIPLVHRFDDYLNPQNGADAPTFAGRAVHAAATLLHRECDNSVCRQVSLSYGAGFPALWRHENISEATHAWLRDEFAHVPLSFYRHITACVQAGRLVPTGRVPGLHEDVAAGEPATRARIALFAGARNRCFLPESQRRTYEHLRRHGRGQYALHVLPGYSHLDVFWGHRAARDVFPLMLSELERPTGARNP